MKIQLSNDELYEIKLPEQIGLNEFVAVVNKFNFLMKNFIKFSGDNFENNIVLGKEQVKERKDYDKNRWKFLRDNRDIYIEILNAHYNKTKKEFYEIVDKHNLGLKKADVSSGQFLRIKELHKVIPDEVGLTQFPNKFKQIVDCRK